MWKEYSISYLKKNRTTSISIIIAALISSLFISLICGIFYNMWSDNVRRIILEEGDWHGRLIGSIPKEDIKTIENYSNVKKVILSDKDTEAGKVVTVYFNHPRSIYEDLPKIANMIGLDDSNIQYHNMLLTQYFIFSPEERANPPMLLAFYIFVMLIACFSLILIIKNAFAVSMNARVQQLGILQSIGATPRQVRSVLIQEAFALCFLPILIGIAAGAGLCFAFIQFGNSVANSVRVENAVFEYNFSVFFITLAASLLTVGLSAWLPARKLSRISPLEAIRGGTEHPIEKVKHFKLFSAMFGIEGELARKSMYTRRKAFKTSALSLTISFLVFSIFLNFMTLSDISTQHTYFERYKNTWDLMIFVKDNGNHEAELLSELRNIKGISDCTAYQKAEAYTFISEDMQSSELKGLGGFEKLKDEVSVTEKGKYLVKVPLIILDDESFQEYCNDIGIKISDVTDTTAITVNTIWDNINSNFKYKQYIPFIKEAPHTTLKLFSDKELTKAAANIKISGYTDKAPNLREEYTNHSLLQVMSANAYQKISESFQADEDGIYFKILAASEGEIADIENSVHSLMKGKYKYTLENRLKKEEFNAEVRNGYKVLMGGLCGLLACIGFANVFSNTLGFMYQRRREFARYISIGLTPNGMKKILLMEALIIGLKPILISIPFNVMFVIFAIKASYLNPIEFIERMPVVQSMIFAVLIMASVGISYYIGGRKIYKSNIIEALRDETMY